MMILNPYTMTFHALIVPGLDFLNFLSKVPLNILCVNADSKSNFWYASNCNGCKIFLMKSLYNHSVDILEFVFHVC